MTVALAKEPKTVVPAANVSESKRMMIPLAKLKPNPDQVRQSWDTSKDEAGKTSLDRLADSIRNQGLLSELVVTPSGDGMYMIVCGERRFRAIRNHNLMKEVPCIVRERLTPAQVIELGITENLLRDDLTPMDEAHAYKELMDKCGYTQATLASRLGISGAMISYKLSLLALSPGLQREVATGRLSETDGRSIAQAVNRISGPNAPTQRAVALQTIEHEIKKEPAKPNGKIDTPVVKRVTEQTVTKVAGSAALPQTRAPKMVSQPPAPPSATKASSLVREEAERLFAVLKDVNEILKPYRKSLADPKLRRDVIRLVLEREPLFPSKIKSALSPLDVIYNEAAQVMNEKRSSVAQPAKPEAKPISKQPAKKNEAKPAKKARR